MKHIATASFWQCYDSLPREVQEQADKQFALLRDNPRHPSLLFKRIRGVWSARVNQDYRALAYAESERYVWIWIGPHTAYERMLKSQ